MLTAGQPKATPKEQLFALDSHQAEIKDFITLVKPGVLLLVIFTGFIGMWLAPGSPHPFLMAVNILALALGSGGAATFNMWYDRDIDRIMQRTAARPIPAGRIAPHDALSLGVILSSLSILLMGLTGSWKAAGLLGFSIFFYSYIYTVILKRRTSQNIVIGGAAGAFPPLIGWMTVTPEITFLPLWMFAIIFLWTPSHFWALALLRAEDYKRAQVPMLPVTHGEDVTRRHIFMYALALVGVSLLPLVTHHFSWFYSGGAGVLGSFYVYYSYRLWHRKAPADAGRLFGYSIIYLFALFTCMALDHGVSLYE